MGFSNWGFLAPFNLLALLGIPLIIILYMLRPKNKPTIIPSTYLWETVLSELESASKIQKLRSSILMLLQILAVLLLALLLAGLYFLKDVDTDHTIIIIDNTITMQAEDLSPSRIAIAKEQGVDYVRNLPKNQRITLIEMQAMPVIHVNQENNPQLVMNMIEGIVPTGLNGDYGVLSEIIGTILKESGGEVVYFGDKTIPRTTTYYIGSDSHNSGISKVAYSFYDDQQISVLADVYSTKEGSVQLSLYGDGVLLDAISVEVTETRVGKAFFQLIPNIFSLITVTIDEGDALAIDNTAYLSIGKTETKKVALFTEGNIFLEKALLLTPALDVYKVQMDNRLDVLGFDFYIFDGVFPETFPTDGTLLLYNPGSVFDVTDLGFATNPNYRYNPHPVVNHLTEQDYVIGVSHVYELPSWAEPMIVVDEGVIAYSGRLGKQDLIVFGFDIHNTDLPLTASFPIMMTNMVDYYLNQNQVGKDHYQLGESVDISLSPSTLSGEIISPSGVVTELDEAVGFIRFYDTFETGVYTLATNTGEGPKEEQFVVNASTSNSNMGSFSSEPSGANSYTTHETNRYLLGGLLLLVLSLEWLIYGIRRGR